MSLCSPKSTTLYCNGSAYIFENLIYFKVDETQRGLTKQRNFGISKVNKVINVVCFLDDDIIQINIDLEKNISIRQFIK